MSRTFELAIVGGGPAGAAAAITAARAGAQVLLLDRDTFPRPKVCGEFVSAESLGLLAGLLGADHPLLTSTPTIAAGRIFFGRGVTHTQIAPAARSIPRYELDHALWRAAEAGGTEAHSQEAVHEIAGDGPFIVRSEVGEYAARSIINASGRWSGVLRAPASPIGPKWIGIKAHFQTRQREDSVDLYFFKHGYCGVQPTGPTGLNVCAMVRADVATTLGQVFDQHPALRKRAASWQQSTDVVITAPLIHEAPQPLVGAVLQVGDAAGFIDPFLGDGISLALHSGVHAARALAPVASGDGKLSAAVAEYAKEYVRSIGPTFRHAARLRRIVSVSQPFQPAINGLLRLPHVTEWLLHKTRPRPIER